MECGGGQIIFYSEEKKKENMGVRMGTLVSQGESEAALHKEARIQLRMDR